MADIDLPVFSFAPNWQNGITETLEWLTDVQRSMLGYEQRRALRLTPRRFFEMKFNPVGRDRSFMSLWFQRFGENPFLLPLWHDQAALSATVISGAQRLDFDNTYREFWTGGLAILRASTFSFEVVEITGQDDGGLDLAEPLSAGWPIGTKLYPLRVAELEEPQMDFSAIVDRVGAADVSFKLIGANPYPTGAETLTAYEGFPVIDEAPNRIDDLRVRFERLYDQTDNQTGRSYRRDEAGRAFASQPHDWRAVGRKSHHELRQTLYRLNGRQKAAWMPTWNEDVVLSAAAASGSTALTIERVGYSYLGGPTSGRDRLILPDENGAKRIVSVTAAALVPNSESERLTISAPAAAPFFAGTVGSFVELVRLDQDSIEITHHTDTDGACEAAAAFKAFQSGRTPPATLLAPAAPAVRATAACNAPHPDEESDCNFSPVFKGWYYKTVILLPTTQNPEPNGGALIHELRGTQASYGNVNFQYGTDGEYSAGAGPHQMHVLDAGKRLVSYFASDPATKGPVEQAFLQLQKTGGSNDPESLHNSIFLQRWDQIEPFLLARFHGATLFPRLFEFDVVPPL